MNVLVAGGGTAGHVFPALALGRALRERGDDVMFAGTPSGQEATLVPQAGFPFMPIEARPFRRDLSVATIAAPIAAIRSIRRSRELVAAADVVVGMGGYTSVPIGLAAMRAKCRLVLHEQNAVPGLANRMLAIKAARVAVSFEEAARRFPRRTEPVLTGNPVREEIASIPERREGLRKEALATFELAEGRRTLVVFGGSLGALHLNRSFVVGLDAFRDRSDVQVLLLTGTRHLDAVRTRLPGSSRVIVRTVGFLERMELAYAAADLVVSRAGATTVAELAVAGLPAILVPYPYATGRHQEANARALERAGAARVILDDAVDNTLVPEAIGLLDRPERLASMGERASAWARPQAARALADLVRATGGR